MDAVESLEQLLSGKMAAQGSQSDDQGKKSSTEQYRRDEIGQINCSIVDCIIALLSKTLNQDIVGSNPEESRIAYENIGLALKLLLIDFEWIYADFLLNKPILSQH